ncbi:hypothetical protein LPC08_25245 (plasmid) [Roseomonas sp. OT10]|uniref:hypothetical protein n=1 Tax=Roseomonas cutis TaxID=2897332 RepID=UPI001E3659F1|nr:hypothetical protein [Roseomonas sp. OT10]UFN51572.1 hypothetical protein LPC08_25245 [Roseomonas sp. OT10]
MPAPLAPTAHDAPDLTALPASAHTDWLRNVLVVTGPTEEMGRFRAAAAGAGVIPWVLDFDGMEEDWFLSLVAPAEGERAISLQGARILARRLRDAAAANHQRAIARIGTDHSCPFDLHRLLPAPPGILRLGPDDPDSRIWLWTHWGTTRPLRHVRELEPTLDGRKRRMAELRVEFWSADWSPWQALRRLRRNWPALSFTLQPDYAGGDDDEPTRRSIAPIQHKQGIRDKKHNRDKPPRSARARRG